MSDSLDNHEKNINQGGEIPTAANWQVITMGNGEDASDLFPTTYGLDNFEDGDELVRMKDAEQALVKAGQVSEKKGRKQERERITELIQKRIQEQEEKVEKYNEFDKLNLNDAKARKQELEELLDEVQNE